MIIDSHKFLTVPHLIKDFFSRNKIMSAENKVASERWAALEANPEVMTKLCHQVSPLNDCPNVF